jgi:hypothetical protein
MSVSSDRHCGSACRNTGAASEHRMRPIMLTAAAASLALIPIAREIFWGPMAYAAMMGCIIVGVFMFKYTLVVILASLFANGAVFAEDRGTPEQRAACAPGAFRLCASYIADATNVEARLRQRKSDLSDACRVTFEQAAGTASAGTIGSLRYRGARDEE